MILNRRNVGMFIPAFFLFHFFMLGLGMFRIDLPGRLTDFQRAYGRVTGAGGSFGFFSPNVPRAVNVEFKIEQPDGQILTTTLQESAPAELQARMSNMVHLVEKSFGKEKVLRALAASFTAAMYRQYPNAKSITLNAYFFNFPNIEDYRQGKRGENKLIYTASFGRKS
jgi:hypothetical protein